MRQLSDLKTRRPVERPAIKRFLEVEKERLKTAGVLEGWMGWRVFIVQIWLQERRHG